MLEWTSDSISKYEFNSVCLTMSDCIMQISFSDLKRGMGLENWHFHDFSLNCFILW